MPDFETSLARPTTAPTPVRILTFTSKTVWFLTPCGTKHLPLRTELPAIL